MVTPPEGFLYTANGDLELYTIVDDTDPLYRRFSYVGSGGGRIAGEFGSCGSGRKRLGNRLRLVDTKVRFVGGPCDGKALPISAGEPDANPPEAIEVEGRGRPESSLSARNGRGLDQLWYAFAGTESRKAAHGWRRPRQGSGRVFLRKDSSMAATDELFRLFGSPPRGRVGTPRA